VPVAREANGVYALTLNVRLRHGKDGKQSVVWLKAHHIRLAVPDFQVMCRSRPMSQDPHLVGVGGTTRA
jgi:hypothetical protein